MVDFGRFEFAGRQMLGDPDFPAEGLEGLGGNTFSLVNEAQKDVLRADVVVVEHLGFFLCQDDNPPCPVGKALKHLSSSPHGHTAPRIIRG